MGSLIFSGLAVFLFGAIYLWLIEAELESLQPYPPELDHGDSPEAP
jgi:hypothetical protein